MCNIFDVETSPDRDKALALMPPFDPEEVKLGNLKNPALIEEKINEAREGHQKSWLDKATLRPETGKILAIGLYRNECGLEILDERQGEAVMLQAFWEKFMKWFAATGRPFTGFNSNTFDVPFLILRSRILGVPVPGGLRKGRYFDSNRFVDLRDEWLMGRDWREFKSSLSYVACSLGLPAKNGDGKNFAELYRTNRSAALNYLAHDIWLTKAVAEKLGFSMSPANESWEQFQARFPVEKLSENKPAEELF